jgi:hypothetical protein
MMHYLTSYCVCDIIVSMRTTLSLDDEAFRLVRQYAGSRSIALGKAVSELVRRAFAMPRPTRSVNGVQVFDLPPDSPRISTKRVLEVDAEEK